MGAEFDAARKRTGAFVPEGARGGIESSEPANRRDSRRERSFLLESSRSSGYDCGLRFDKWEMSATAIVDALINLHQRTHSAWSAK